MLTLTEQIADWHAELAVDRSARLVRNVALTGRESRNGYRYCETALAAAVPLYQHKPVFLDHAADRNRPQERSTRDLVGSIVHPRYERGRIRGDIRVLDTESGRTFLALAESDTRGVGMSHVVIAERTADGSLVQRIHDVVSVDAVVNPATTTTFQESAPRDEEEAGKGEQGEREQESRDTVSTAERAESDAETAAAAASAPDELSAEFTNPIHLRFQLAAVTRERDALAQRLAVLESRQDEQQQQARIESLLAELQLPEQAVSESFRRQLHTAAGDDARRELIRERAALVQRLRRAAPQSVERAAAASSAAASSQFVAAIRARR